MKKPCFDINSLSSFEKDKLEADKFYFSQYQNGHSYKSLQRSGWLNHCYSLEEMNKVYDSLYSQFYHYINNNEIFILLNTGSYAPTHAGHINMMKKAKEKIKSLGLSSNPIMVMSPSHDKYVLTKSEDISHWNINNRIEKLYEEVALFPKDSDDVYLVDTWEAVCCDYPVNFTDVIIKYIKDLDKLNINYKIGYVFGSDNEEFIFPFENLSKEDKSKFYAICVERDNYPFHINSKEENIIYIKSDIDYSHLNSRSIRKKIINEKSFKYKSFYCDNEKSFYAVREDSDLALKKWIEKYPNKKEVLQRSYKEFHEGLKKVLSLYTKHKTQTIELDVQREIVSKINEKSLNLDVGTHELSTYMINYGRVFLPGAVQAIPEEMVKRPENTVETNIPPGEYIFVDDDIASGKTFELMSKILGEKGIIFKDKVNLTQKYCEKIDIEYNLFDIVDTKDFLLGSYSGGLICKIQDKVIRLPYFSKYINLYTRATIPYSDISSFNRKILSLNKIFFKQNPFLMSADLNEDLLRFLQFDLTIKKNNSINDILEKY